MADSTERKTKFVVEVPCMICGLVIVTREFDHGDNAIAWYSDGRDHKCDVCIASEQFGVEIALVASGRMIGKPFGVLRWKPSSLKTIGPTRR